MSDEEMKDITQAITALMGRYPGRETDAAIAIATVAGGLCGVVMGADASAKRMALKAFHGGMNAGQSLIEAPGAAVAEQERNR